MLMSCRNRRVSYILHAVLIVINILTVHDLIAPVTGSPAVEPPNKSVRDDVTADGASRSDQRSMFSSVDPELPHSTGNGQTNRQKSPRNMMAGENRNNSPINTADRNIDLKPFLPGNRSPTFSQHSSGIRSSVKFPPDDTMAEGGRFRRSRWSRYKLLRSSKRSSDESAQADEPDRERIEPMAYNLRSFDADELMKGGKYSYDRYGKLIPEWSLADRNELEETELSRLQSEEEPISADSNDVLISEEPEVSTDKRAYPPHVGDSLLKRLAAAGKSDLGSWNGNQRGWVSNNVRIWG